MRRLAVILSISAFVVVLTTSSASARGPKWEFLPAGPATLPAASCGFPVALDFPRNEEFAKAFPTDPPARTTVQAAALPRGSRVEIDAIAVKRSS